MGSEDSTTTEIMFIGKRSDLRRVRQSLERLRWCGTPQNETVL